MRCRIVNLHRLSFVVWSSVAFVGLGVALSILGPTLLDLAARLSVGVAAISSLFTVRALGAVTGSVVSGILLDRLSHYSYAIVSVTLLIAMITLCIVPYSVHLVMTGVFIFICGAALGSLDNGCNTVLLRLWKTGSGPSMQLLHFSFGVGAVLAPLLAEPFITSVPGDPPTNLTCSQVNLTSLDAFNASCLLHLFNETCSGYLDGNHGNQSRSNDTFSASNCTLSAGHGGSLRYAYAYLLGTAPLVLALVGFTYHSATTEFGHCYKRKLSLGDPAGGAASGDERNRPHLQEKPHLLFKVAFFPCIFLFICLYCGMETSYGNFVFTFAVESLYFSKQRAALLNAVFWGTFTVGRFLAIFIAYTRVPSSVVITVDTLGSTLSLLVMSACPGNEVVAWVGSAALGGFMASIYPTAMFWLSEQVEVSGKAVAVVTTGAVLGDMTLPLMAGFLIAQLSPSALVPFAFVGTVMYTVVGGLLFLIAFIERRRRRSSAGVVYSVLEDREPGGEEEEEGRVPDVELVEDKEPSVEVVEGKEPGVEVVEGKVPGVEVVDSLLLSSELQCSWPQPDANMEQTDSDTPNPGNVIPSAVALDRTNSDTTPYPNQAASSAINPDDMGPQSVENSPS